MKQQHTVDEGFQERLLQELQDVIIAQHGGQTAPRRPRWKRGGMRVAAVAVAAIALAIIIAQPIVGGDRLGTPAYAVTKDASGVVTVEIRSIEDATGLEAAIEATGVSAAVHYLPAGKVCGPPPDDETSIPVEFPGAAQPQVTITETGDGTFMFTFDTRLFSPGDSVVIYAQRAATEDGQPQDLIASIGAIVLHGDFHDCALTDGGMKDWTFQQGAVPGDQS
jgi:hypothetical protein